MKRIHSWIKLIEKKFGKEIGHLIERVSELSRIRYSLAINIRDKNNGRIIKII